MKRCMQYFCIGLVLSFQLTAQASVRETATIPVNLDGLASFKIINNVAYFGLERNGFKFFDLSQPSEVEECSNQVVRCNLLGSTVNYIDIVGNYAYLSTDYGLEIINVSRAERVGVLPISNASRFVIQNNLVYLIVGNLQVSIIDVSDPTKPKSLSPYKSDLFGFDKIAISGDYLYLTGSSVKYFFIIDVSHPNAPKEIIRYQTKDEVSNLAVIGGYLYVTGSNEVSIFEVSTPTSPSLLSSKFINNFFSIIIQGDYAYFIGSDGLTIVDISYPKNPFIKENFSFPYGNSKAAISNSYIYLATNSTLKTFKFEPVAIVCSYTVNTTQITLKDWDFSDENGIGMGSIEITTNDSSCKWTAKSDSEWLIISPSKSEGVGNATIQYAYAPNPDSLIRTAKLTIAGNTVNATQRPQQGTMLFGNSIGYANNSEAAPSSIESQYSKTYKLSEPIDEIKLYFWHYYNQFEDTDVWLAVSLPFQIEGTNWLYKENYRATGMPYGFTPTLDPAKNMKYLTAPFSKEDIESTSKKWKEEPYKWTVLPSLPAHSLPAGVYTFYAIATIKERDKTSPTVKWISYNPITYFGDLTKIFSNLAVFKLIITD